MYVDVYSLCLTKDMQLSRFSSVTTSQKGKKLEIIYEIWNLEMNWIFMWEIYSNLKCF